MQFRFQHILSFTLAMLLSLALSSCDSDAPDIDGATPGGYATLLISVDTGSDIPARGRSAFDDFDNEQDKWGIDGENMETLRIIIIDSTDVVECNALYRLDNADAAGEYELRVRRNETKHIFLVSNETYYSLDEAGMEIAGGTTSLASYLGGLRPGARVKPSTLQRLTLALKHNSPDGRGQSLRTPLPISAMYTEHIGDDEVTYRTYDMHRAAVKYTFRIVNLSKYPHRLEKLRIDRVADREYLFPDADWTTNELGHTVLEDYRTPATAREGYYEYRFAAPLQLPAAMERAVSALPSPVYVPEGLKGSAPQRVSLNLDGTDLDVWCDLLWRMPGETEAVQRPMVDLPRNTHVVVNITIREDNKIELVADVQPYASVEPKPWFGFERDENGNIIIERYEDGTMKVIINQDTVRVDADGDRIIRGFADGSVQCKEVVYKDYIHDTSEVDYEYIFEKDRPGGNIIVCRVSGGLFHAAEHEHGPEDRATFILDREGVFKRVIYDDRGNTSYSLYNEFGDSIIQVNGYQFRAQDEMQQYINTYLALTPDGREVLRDCKTDELKEWNPERATIIRRRHR